MCLAIDKELRIPVVMFIILRKGISGLAVRTIVLKNPKKLSLFTESFDTQFI
jgi:hypothetical protein